MADRNYGFAIVVGILIGYCVGLFIGMVALNICDTSTKIKVDVLDEVCVQLYGNGTESYNPNLLNAEEELKCRKIPIIIEKEPLLPDSKIKFIDGESKKC